MKASRTAAGWIIGISILHSVLFLWAGRGLLGPMAREGFWNTIRAGQERKIVFWALLAGAFLFFLGQLALWIAKQGKALPGFLGWQLLGITVVCGILMPVSGAWLFAVPGMIIVLRSSKG